MRVIRFIFILVLLYVKQYSIAQLNADFTANITSGCSPIQITFSDNSTGNNIVYRRYVFGNGNYSQGNATSVVSTYINAGQYSVTLIISDGVDTASITKTDFISVFQKPTANFSLVGANFGCINYNACFNNNTILGSSGIVSYTWDFGDGSGLVYQETPCHVYSNSGSFGVSLQLVDSNGCADVFYQNNLVFIPPAPVAQFAVTGPSYSCSAPFTANFTNTSTGTTALQYTWNYDDSTIINGSSSNHTYNAFGLYYPKLIVTDTYGCQDSLQLTNPIRIAPVTANFQLSNDTVCLGGTLQKSISSVNANQYYWYTSSGITGSGTAFIPSFNTAGLDTVFLVGAYYGQCHDTAYKEVYVEEVVADFTAANTYYCDYPAVVNFTNLSSPNATSFVWRMATSNSVSVQSFMTNASVTLNQVGFFDDTLVAISSFGCRDTVVKDNYIQVNRPLVNFTPNAGFTPLQVGCIPASVQFFNQSVSSEPITQYLWQFGASDTSSAPNPNYTFVVDGITYVTLNVTVASGCTISRTYSYKVGSQPNASFVFFEDTICAAGPVKFFNTSTDSTKIDQYSWFFSDGSSSSNRSPVMSFNDTGHISVAMIAGYFGCYDTVYVDSAIYAKGPVCKFISGKVCDSSMVFNFAGQLIDATRFEWDFGDNTYDTSNIIVSHTYANSGNYTVILTAYNDSNGCAYVYTSNIKVRNLQLDFTMSDTIVCLGTPVTFNNSISVDADGSYDSWQFGDGTSVLASNSGAYGNVNVNHTYWQTGTFAVRAISNSSNGCIDTLFKQIRVFKPNAIIAVDTNSGCIPFNVQFADSSIVDTSIVSWQWIFGNNQTSTSQHPIALYDKRINNQYFSVSLKVTDAVGCKDTVSLNNYILGRQPIFQYSISDPTLCVDQNSSFAVSSSVALQSAEWDFGDMNTLTGLGVQHAYTDSGHYQLSVTAIDTYGCDSTKVISNAIHVQQPGITNFGASITDTACYPAFITFYDSTQTSYLQSLQWNFGDNSNFISTSTSTPVFNTYSNPGKYDITLISTTTYGCKDTIVKDDFISVIGPVLNFEFTPDSACRGVEVDFITNNKTNVGFLNWDFGDGNSLLTTGDVDTITHVYTQIGTVYAILVYSDSMDQCKKVLFSEMLIHSFIAQFDFVSDSGGCEPYTGVVESSSLAADHLFWDFGNGITSTQPIDTFYFPTAGEYVIKLSALSDSLKCFDTITHSIVVYPIPDITTTTDTLICKFDSIEVFASGGATYAWSQPQWMNDIYSATPIISPKEKTRFDVTVTTEHSCVDSAFFEVDVQQFPEIRLPNDTTVIVGEKVDFTVDTDQKITYQWWPTDGLSCSDCPDPIMQPLFSTLYTLTITDSMQCFNLPFSVALNIRREFSLDMPDTFTPNADGNNDEVFVKGWGLEELKEFSVFTRFGQQVFTTNDFSVGWNGKFNDEYLPADSYAYFVKVRTYENKELTKSGVISLVR